jgi:hypothetical protein
VITAIALTILGTLDLSTTVTSEADGVSFTDPRVFRRRDGTKLSEAEADVLARITRNELDGLLNEMMAERQAAARAQADNLMTALAANPDLSLRQVLQRSQGAPPPTGDQPEYIEVDPQTPPRRRSP